MSYGSYTAYQPPPAKLDLSLLLKPSASGSSKRPAEDEAEDHKRASLELPDPLDRQIPIDPLEARRLTEEAITAAAAAAAATSSAATTPSLATANTSRHPSLPTITTPDFSRTSLDLSNTPRPTLPPLRASPPHVPRVGPAQQHGPPGFLTARYPSNINAPNYNPAKRQRTTSPPAQITAPAKRQSKWSAEEDAVIIELRGSGMKWEDISKNLPGRSAISCRLHYQNYLEKRSEWDEEKKNRLARLYERLKPEMWAPLAAELGIPWRAAEAMHWQIGEREMASRAGVTPFSLSIGSSQSRQTLYQTPLSLPPTHHQRVHSDPPHEGNYNLSRYGGPQDGRQYHQPPPPPPMTENTEQIIHLTRPPSPVIKMSPGEQSHRQLPSMAELDQGLTAAAMADSRRYSVPPRR